MLWQGSGERTTAGSAQTKGRGTGPGSTQIRDSSCVSEIKIRAGTPFHSTKTGEKGKAKRQEILGSETSRLREPGEATGGSAVHTPISGDSFVFQTMGKVLRKG